ncbi:uncharacterized protein [Littorina saxatilis]|uniref:uncharacterized protein isoform X1 n=1 Tax=Littorina saxatilis TaxID=31220 RepID=UPI0038B686BB
MRHLQASSTRRMFVQASTKRDRKTPFASADKATDRGMSTRQLCALLPGRRHSLPQTRRQIGGCPLDNFVHFCQEDAIRFRRQGDRSGDVHSLPLQLVIRYRQLCALLPGRHHSLPQTRRQIGECPLSSAAVSDQVSTTLSTLHCG